MTLKLAGTVFGNLTVIKKSHRERMPSGYYKTFWECICLCGKTSAKCTGDLRSGSVKSCGCCEWQIHHYEAYVSWTAMKQRCKTVTNKDYPRYGAIGITYQPSWESFTEFFKDMGDPGVDTWTKERLSLDRIDNNGNYTKENCRWATRSEQQLNKGKAEQNGMLLNTNGEN